MVDKPTQGELTETTEFFREKLADTGKINSVDGVEDYLIRTLEPIATLGQRNREVIQFQLTMNEGGAHLNVNGTMDAPTLEAYQKARMEYNTNGLTDKERAVMGEFIETHAKALGSNWLGHALQSSKDYVQDEVLTYNHTSNVERTKDFQKAWNAENQDPQNGSYRGMPIYRKGFVPLEQDGKVDDATRAAIDTVVREHDVKKILERSGKPSPATPQATTSKLEDIKSQLSDHQQSPQDVTQVAFNNPVSNPDKTHKIELS